jgi:hypothetical protein
MFVHFSKMSGGTIAVNPKHVMLIQEAPNGCDIVMVDGGTTRVTTPYIEVVGILNGQTH